MYVSLFCEGDDALGLADDEMFQTFQAVFDAFDFRFQQVVRIVEAAVCRDASALEIYSEQVAADDNRDLAYWLMYRFKLNRW